MKSFILISLFLAAASFASSQPTNSPKVENLDLNNRYLQMKTTSQTFQDYKVIKEVALDGFWKMTMDSVRKQRMEIKSAQESIALLKSQVKAVNDSIKTVNASVKEIVYDSTHISFFGISLHKAFFVTLITLITVGLIVIIGLLFGRMRLMDHAVKEKTESNTLLADEYEQYKRKSLEKEKKLSRELQTERNKLQEMKRA